MSIKRKTMHELKKRYGEDRGEDIYFALEQKEKRKSISKRRNNKYTLFSKGG